MTKNVIYFQTRIPDYPDVPKEGEYQHASIKVFFMRPDEIEKGELPYWATDNYVSFSYQRHYENGTMKGWYAETIEHVPGQSSDDLMNVANLMKKMEAFSKKMNEKGFYSMTDDHIRYRLSLLKGIGAIHVKVDSKNGAVITAVPCGYC
jgi:hypothetical protein